MVGLVVTRRCVDNVLSIQCTLDTRHTEQGVLLWLTYLCEGYHKSDVIFHEGSV